MTLLLGTVRVITEGQWSNGITYRPEFIIFFLKILSSVQSPSCVSCFILFIFWWHYKWSLSLTHPKVTVEHKNENSFLMSPAVWIKHSCINNQPKYKERCSSVKNGIRYGDSTSLHILCIQSYTSPKLGCNWLFCSWVFRNYYFVCVNWEVKIL